MNVKYMVALCACFMMTACGSSSSNDSDQTKLNTPSTEFSAECANSVDSQACQDTLNEANQAGLTSPFGDPNSPFGDSAFNGAGGVCGCPNGTTPVVFGNNGLGVCESTSARSQQRTSVIRVRRVKRPNKDKFEVSFEHYVNTDYETQYSAPQGNSDTCFAPSTSEDRLCRRNRHCRGAEDQYGRPVRAVCEPISGQDYGYCRAVIN